jgi:hypothetical protein
MVDVPLCFIKILKTVLVFVPPNILEGIAQTKLLHVVEVKYQLHGFDAFY